MQPPVKKKNNLIIYVNFAPYENAGKILDFLFERFDVIVSFRFNFHRLSGSSDNSRLIIYRKGKSFVNHPLYYIPTPPSIAFIILPIRSFIIFLQIIYYLIQINYIYGTPNTYFTVNAFTAWCGNVAKKLGLVKRTVFWVWDYYPPNHKDTIVRFMRWLYWHYDKSATLKSDAVIFLNSKLETLRKKINLLPKFKKYDVVEIGTNPIPTSKTYKGKTLRLVYLGVLKQSQGLDVFFDSAIGLKNKFLNITLDIIGSGPDEDYFKSRALSCPINVRFHGYISDDIIVDEIISKCHIGLAIYENDKSNVYHFSDPSKIKRYISQGLPVITTNVFEFSKEIVLTKSGILVTGTQDNLINAIVTITNNYVVFSQNALRLANKYYYRKIYPRLFNTS